MPGYAIIVVLLGLLPLNMGHMQTPAAKQTTTTCQSHDNTSKVTISLDFNEVVKSYKAMLDNCKIDPKRETMKPTDCADLKEVEKKSGEHKIWPRSRVVSGSVDVLCDMDDDGGGWTVIQRRGDFNSSNDYFYRDWDSYKVGFGDIQKDFWLGNDIIFALTNQRACSMKVVMIDWGGNSAYAAYDDFWIDDELHNYTAHVNGYRGTAGDSFTYHNGKPFSTKDRKNDPNPNSCAVEFKGAWWYDKCHESNLNGLYLRGPHETFANGVNWKAFKEYKYSLKDTFIKIRPKKMH